MLVRNMFSLKNVFLFGRYLLILFIINLIIPLAGAEIQHPSVLFNNITDVYCYYHDDDFRDPSGCGIYLRGIRILAEKNNTFALALLYHIERNDSYLQRVKTLLYNFNTSDNWGYNLRDALIAYDLIQPFLSSTEDERIRDNLAKVADSIFSKIKENPNYVSFWDYHGRAYVNLAWAGLILMDYTNPNGLPLNSTPSDWLKAGTEYYFVNDPLHNFNRSIGSFGFDDEGMDYLGGYRSYYMVDLFSWFMAYSNFFNRSIFYDYPWARKMATMELWSVLPIYYSPNYCTNGNTRWVGHWIIVDLFNDYEKQYILNYLNMVEKYRYLLEHSRDFGIPSDLFLYVFKRNYSNISAKNPKYKSYLSNSSFFKVFRESWSADSNWMSFITYKPEHYYKSKSNRNMWHHDQLSIEFYSKGDLLIADGGEVKCILDKQYGSSPFMHNVLVFEDPRGTFPYVELYDTSAAGIHKAYLENMVKHEDIIESDSIEAVRAKVTVSKAYNQGWDTISLPTEIVYERTIIFPKNYFIVIDSAESNETWIWRNVWRFSSLNITPTGDLDGDGVVNYSSITDIGHVKGNLTVENITFDWLSFPYKKEILANTTAKNIKWETINVFGKKVILHLYTIPESEVILLKHTTRISGYNCPSEVFSPNVYLRTNESNDLKRITILYARYENDPEPTFLDLSTENYSMIKIKWNFSDYIAVKKNGNSVDGIIKTDAEYSFVRDIGVIKTALAMLNVSYISFNNTYIVSSTKPLNYLTYELNGSKKIIKVSGNGTATITVYGIDPGKNYTVTVDGYQYENWEKIDDKILIHINLSEHTIVVAPSTEDILPPEFYEIKVVAEKYSAKITWRTNEPSTSVVRYGTSSGVYTQEVYDGNYVLLHEVTIKNLQPNKTYFFVVAGRDIDGNYGESEEYNFTTVEAVPPITTYTITPKPHDNGTVYDKVVITFFRSDNIRVAYTNYSLTSPEGPWIRVDGDEPFNVTIDKDGNITIWFFSVDINGNEESLKKITLYIVIKSNETYKEAYTTAYAGGGGGGVSKRIFTKEFTDLNEDVLIEVLEEKRVKYREFIKVPKTALPSFLSITKYTKKYPTTGYFAEILKKEISEELKNNIYDIVSENVIRTYYWAETVIIVRGDLEVDGCASIVLSKNKNAPILLTKPNELPKSTLNAIKKLKPKEIIIVGGPKAVSVDVENSLKNLAKVKRIWGETRVETSVEIAKLFVKPEYIIISNSSSTEKAIYISYFYNAPIIYIWKEELPESVEEYLRTAFKSYPKPKIIFVDIGDDIKSEIYSIYYGR